MATMTNNSTREMFAPPDWLAEKTAKQQSMAPYCGLGFRRGKLEPDLHTAMRDKLAECATLFQPEMEIDEIGSVDPGYIPVVYMEDLAFNEAVAEALQPAHEDWSGMALSRSACYGFRVYQRGSYLHNHVDRTSTHIISSTICVDLQVDEPWPLYLEDIDGNAHLVDLEPGEFIYYEGARLLHGRPWPLRGDYYVGMFVHYSPNQEQG